MVIDVGDVLDIDPNADKCLVILIGKIKLGVVCRNTNGLALGAYLELIRKIDLFFYLLNSEILICFADWVI